MSYRDGLITIDNIDTLRQWLAALPAGTSNSIATALAAIAPGRAAVSYVRMPDTLIAALQAAAPGVTVLSNVAYDPAKTPAAMYDAAYAAMSAQDAAAFEAIHNAATISMSQLDESGVEVTVSSKPPIGGIA